MKKNNLTFRELEPNEIEIRAARCGDGWAQLLLYKDARVDMNILDETVGALNWKREHSRDNANCIVSIWDDDKGQWISKEDTGTESNTEKEKGLASDSFKRACTNWGIGRSLYTVPSIMVSIKTENKNGRWQIPAKSRLWVSEYDVVDGIVSRLVICEGDGLRVFNYDDKRIRRCLSGEGKRAAKTEEPSSPVVVSVEEKKPATAVVASPDPIVSYDVEEIPIPIDLPNKDIKPAKPAEEPQKATPAADVDKTRARITKAEFGQTSKGMNYVRIVYSMRYSSEELEQFQPIINNLGVAEIVKTIKGLNVLTEEEINSITLNNLTSVHAALFEVNAHKDYEYSVIKSKNAKGYDVFTVKRV